MRDNTVQKDIVCKKVQKKKRRSEMETKKNSKAKLSKLHLILDLDNTLFDFDQIYQAVYYLVHCLCEHPNAAWRRVEDKLNCVKSFIPYLLSKAPSTLRPNLILLIQKLKQLKKSGEIESINILTAGQILDTSTLAGEFFVQINTTPQELLLEAINKLDTLSSSSEKNFYDEIKFTNGAKKSVEDFNHLSGRFIIIDDMAYEENYEMKKNKLLILSTRKRKRMSTKTKSWYLPNKVFAHIQIPIYLDSFPLDFSLVILFINSYFRDFTGCSLDTKSIQVYSKSLEEKFLNIKKKRQTIEKWTFN